MDKLAILEGLLFIEGDEGISLNDICEILDVNIEEAKKLLSELQKEYDDPKRGIRISFLGGEFKLTTKKEHKCYYEKLIKTKKDNLLSDASLETLAIIAYNEPITRAEIEEKRGISSSYVIRKLIARDLIKVSGKSSLPGKPNLYRTTKEFLDYFGLSSLNDLPDLDMQNLKNNDEQDLFTSIYKENN